MGGPCLLAPPTPGWSIVTNLNTLRAVERAGWIALPRWGKRDARYVIETDRLTEDGHHWSDCFVVGRRTFRITYVDGCFKPFLQVYKGVK